MSKLSPRESGKLIAANSKHVTVHRNSTAAKEIFQRMKEQKYSRSLWKQWPLHPKNLTKETVDWIFVVDSLNFSFWLAGEKQFQLEYNEKVYEDYEALCAAINRALDEGVAITTPAYYKDITLDEINHVFRSCNGTVLPLLEQRQKNLNEAGKILCEKYNGSFSNLLLECDHDVNHVIQKVTHHFTSFRDEATFDEQTVCFYKRIQILIADMWACFDAQSFGEFHNIELLTMFADYRVPQALLALNLLSYSEELMCKLQNNVQIPSDSREEMEIRGCSIHAVEILREEIGKLNESTVHSLMLDFYLWDFATHNPEKMKGFPEHRTRSTFY